MKDLTFKRGDRVRLTSEAARYYGGRGVWVPESQGGGQAGTVLLATWGRPCAPGADPRPYYIHWDNGTFNSYREGDLEVAS